MLRSGAAGTFGSVPGGPHSCTTIHRSVSLPDGLQRAQLTRSVSGPQKERLKLKEVPRSRVIKFTTIKSVLASSSVPCALEVSITGANPLLLKAASPLERDECDDHAHMAGCV